MSSMKPHAVPGAPGGDSQNLQARAIFGSTTPANTTPVPPGAPLGGLGPQGGNPKNCCARFKRAQQLLLQLP